MKTGQEFIATLVHHQLIDASRLQQVVKIHPLSDSKLLAKELIRRGWLTAFQTNQVFLGRGNSLILGSFILLERLGAGGMGEVFKAKNQNNDQVVALKVIRKEYLQSTKTHQRFQREIEATSQLNHSNIVRAYGTSEAGGNLLFVMEYLEGTDLLKLVKEQGPMSFHAACDCICQAALGLQHAHEKGLVHRDIKPSNLFLTKKGVVKILDLGLVRQVDVLDHTLTQEGAVLGTADYVSPEQAMSSHTVDIRADIYSLGAAFYFLLTGSVPFKGGTLAEKMVRLQLREPEAVEKLRQGLSPQIAAIVRNMMAKKPDDRYQTPAQVVAALNIVLQGKRKKIHSTKRDNQTIKKTLSESRRRVAIERLLAEALRLKTGEIGQDEYRSRTDVTLSWMLN